MARFTTEQKKFSEAMKLLINLYYRFLETGREEWFSDTTIQLVAKIFDFTIPNFSPCLYIREYSKFRFRGSNEGIRISEFHIHDFLKFMKAIHTDISNGILSFFEFSERIVRTQVRANLNTLPPAEQIESVEYNKIKNMKGCKIIPPIPKEADTETLAEYLHTRNMTLNEQPAEYESFRLLVTRDSALDKEFLLEDGATISCPGYLKPEISFRSAVKYILVKYQFLLGSFERIKICKQCEKLFVEKKLGAREYCSGTCRKRHYDSLQPEEKRLCRERQNAWIRYRRLFNDWPRVFTLQKDDCLNCPGTVESGRCPVLIRKNNRGFEKSADFHFKKR